MDMIGDTLQAVRARIAHAARDAGRDPASVALVAVSKMHPAARIAEAAAAGQRAFGENYVQEALAKMDMLGTQSAALEWHFIGPLQSNKTRQVAERFAWVQSVDRLKIAERLSAQRPAGQAPLNVLLQVNISGESTKSGVAPADAAALAQGVAGLPRLALRGLMAVPEPAPDRARQRACFAMLRELFERLRAAHPGMDTLSMGMSDDLESAVAEGATLVRIGTAIFGARPPARAAA
ncbi:MAG TPA: YggS family pyridoxal phosphate-dependent enzyme [Burkholderiales bacterium]